MIDLKSVETYHDGVFYVKVSPDDAVTQFNVNNEKCVERIIEDIPIKYRDKVVGLKRTGKCTYHIVFDDETQKEWDAEYNKYISRKAAWCQKYGSE